MNIRELLKSEAKISLTMSLEDLRQVFKELLGNNSRLIKEEPPPEEFISRKEVLNRLEIDSSTLWNWEKTGYIKSYPFGGRKRYKVKDVEAIRTGRKVK